MEVVVEDKQLSLAIGKKGQNVRLASKLTGWQLEISGESQPQAAGLPLHGLEGIGPAMEERLKAAGITTVPQLAAMSLEQLTAIKGIGEKTAQKLLETAQAALAAAPPAPSAGGTEPAGAPAEASEPAEQAPGEEAAASGEPPPSTEQGATGQDTTQESDHAGA